MELTPFRGHDAYFDIWFAFPEALAGDLEYSAGEESFAGGRAFKLTRPWTDIPTNPMLHFRCSTLGVSAAVISDRADRVLKSNMALQALIRAVLESQTNLSRSFGVWRAI